MFNKKYRHREMKTLAFTGHRPNKLNGYNKDDNKDLIADLRCMINKMYDIGFRVFISGMALGVDQWAAEEVIRLKIIHSDIKLVAAIPCQGQESKWRMESQIIYRDILKLADEVVMVNDEPYFDKCMQRRNEYMVDRADAILAVWDGSYGGTGNCIKYAEYKDKSIITINPNQYKNG